MNRREFIKAAGAVGCLGLPGISRLAYAAPTRETPLLTVLFLRGGADALQLVAPTADPDYVAARPPELRVAESGERAGIALERSLDPAAGFRLHGEAGPLAGLYQAGRCAIVHAVGLTDGTRSHFVAQDMIERGIGDGKRLAAVDNGWLSRSLPASAGVLPAYSATVSPAFALHGTSSVLATPDLAAGLTVPWGAPTAGLLQALAEAGDSPAHQATRATLDTLQLIDRKIPRDGGGKVLPYRPSGTASYEGAGDLARTLASVARLARMDVGLTTACVDCGGWDTHEGQGPRFAGLTRQLALGLAAFHEDMAAAGRPQVTVVMTEFGRRLRSNRSGGTDHGHGACWLLLGDGVRGGRMFGTWPGLGTPQLAQGVDLAVTTDYRAVLAEVLATCGLDARAAFPAWRPSAPLGLFGIPGNRRESS